MKVLHLSTSDTGGAGRATYRTHQGLLETGIDSQMLVRNQFNDNRSVRSSQSKLQAKLAPFNIPSRLNDLPLFLYPKRQAGNFSSQWLPNSIRSYITRFNPDIIHLHWIGGGYLSIEAIAKLGKPVVWTLHDMWPFTGGCFYTQNCDRYIVSCGHCPHLNSGKENDLSHWVWQRKMNAWKQLDLTIVPVSNWLAQCARTSSLFKDRAIQVIPNALDLSVYQPFNPRDARRALNLPQDKHLILFGALRATQDKRKGFHLLCPALKQLSETEWQDKIELVIFGSSAPSEPIDLGFKTHYLGHLHDDIALALVYSAASVMVVPSLQEAFGQTASEAIACGTPVVAFDQTGVADIVDHQQNGYLARPFEIDDLAHGIAWVLEDSERYARLCQQARTKAEQEFALTRQSEDYCRLYTKILSR